MTTATDSERGSADGPWPPAALVDLRSDARQRAVALVVAVALGLVVAWLHWLGLVVAGALVGLVSRSPPRAVVWGVVVGLLAIVLTVLTHPIGPAPFVAFRPPVYVTVAVGLVAPIWGSLVRLAG